MNKKNFRPTKTFQSENSSKIPCEIQLIVSKYEQVFWKFRWTHILKLTPFRWLNWLIQLLTFSLWNSNCGKFSYLQVSTSQFVCSFSHLLEYFSTFCANKSTVNNTEIKVVKKHSEEIIRFKGFNRVKSLNCSFCETEVEPFFTSTCIYVTILLQSQFKSSQWNFRRKVKKPLTRIQSIQIDLW